MSLPHLAPRALAAAALLCAAATAQSPRLLGAQSPSTGFANELVEIDFGSAAGAVLGSLPGTVRALAGGPAGTLYAVDNSGSRLVTLDPNTGAIDVVVGTLNGQTLEALCVHPFTGVLWGFTTQGSALVQIAPSNAQVFVVAVAPISAPGGITWSADGTRLFAVDRGTGGFYELNQTSGVATLIGVGEAGPNGGPVGMTTNPQTGTIYVAEDRGGADATLATVDPATGMRTNVGAMTGYDSIQGLAVVAGGNVGVVYCTPSVPNSTGASATAYLLGSVIVAANDLTVGAADLPPNAFGYFLTSRQSDFVPLPGGSMGNLCLGGAIGRYVGPGQIQQADANGTIELALDLTAMPQPQGFVPAMIAQRWNFQAWYRDAIGGTATSNFTDGVYVVFQ
jgi:hypothetical protein